MKPIARYLAISLLALVGLQAALLCATHLRASKYTTIDTYEAFGSQYVNGLRMSVYGTPKIAQQSARAQLVVLGTSDALLGLRPQMLHPLLNMPVHNLATEQQNIRSFAALIDLIYMQTPRENWRNLHFVIAVSATAFKPDTLRWPNGISDVEQEMLRYGAFQRTKDGPEPLLGKSLVSASLEFALPFMLPLEGYGHGMRALLNSPRAYAAMKMLLPQSWWFGVFKPWFPGDFDSDRQRFSAQQRMQRIDFLNAYMETPTLSNESFAQLEQIAAQVSAAGGQLYFVDLPTASWLQRGLHVHADYQRRKLPYIARLQAMPRVHYIPLQQGFTDDAFFDGTHPRAAVRPVMAKRVAAAMAKTLPQHTLNTEQTNGQQPN